MTPHSPASDAALAAVTALLGPAASIRERNPTVPGSPTAAWRVRGGILHLDGYASGLVGVEAQPHDDDRECFSTLDTADVLGAVRAALRHLASEPEPRPTLPGLAPDADLAASVEHLIAEARPHLAAARRFPASPEGDAAVEALFAAHSSTATRPYAPPDPHAATVAALDALDAARRERSAAVGYDANGRLAAGDDGCGELFGDYGSDAA